MSPAAGTAHRVARGQDCRPCRDTQKDRLPDRMWSDGHKSGGGGCKGRATKGEMPPCRELVRLGQVCIA